MTAGPRTDQAAGEQTPPVPLHIVTEGQTEEGFVRTVLAPHLARFGVLAEARCVMTSRSKTRIYRGGLRMYGPARLDLMLWMQEDPRAHAAFTTMFDLYALPRDFPGFEKAFRRRDPYETVEILERAFAADLQDSRFIPYIQLHEFETLVFADATQLVPDFPAEVAAIHRLVKTAGEFRNPELINCGRETAPSKRIIAEIPAYRGRKASAGPLVTSRIGLEKLRAACRHFDEWLARLEALTRSWERLAPAAPARAFPPVQQ